MGTKRRSRALGCIVLTLVAGVAAGCGGGAASQVTVRAQQYPGDTAATRRRLASLARTFEVEARCAPGEQVDVTGIAPGVYGVSGCKAFRDYQLVCGANDLAAAFRVQQTICEWEPLPDLRATAAAALGCTPDNLVGRVENGQRVVEGCGARAAYGVECRGGCRWVAPEGEAAAVERTRPTVSQASVECGLLRWSETGDELLCTSGISRGEGLYWETGAIEVIVLSPSGREIRRHALERTWDEEYSYEKHPLGHLISLDGGAVAYVIEHEGQRHLRVMSVQGDTLLDRTLPAGRVWELESWHPSGDELLVRDGDRLFVLQIRTGRTRSFPEAEHAAWSPDGERVALLRVQGENADVFVARADGSRMQRRARLPRGREGSIAWSDDGQWLAVAGGSVSFVRAAGEAATFLSDRGGGIAVWSSDGTGVFTFGEAPNKGVLFVYRTGQVRQVRSVSEYYCWISSFAYSPRSGLAIAERCEGGWGTVYLHRPLYGLRGLPAARDRPTAADPPAAAPTRVPASDGSLTGTYPYVHGSGWLSLRELPDGDVEVAIVASSESGNQCNFGGTLQWAGGVGGARRWVFREAGEDWAGPCEVALEVAGDGLSVSAAGCSAYCGNEARLDGEATHPPRTPSFRPLERY